MSDVQIARYLQPEIVSTLNNLELIAKLVVEGFLTGLHKSPFHGFSVEFSQHRPYLPGDNLRYLDWKVFGRTGRYYIKQFEEETNLRSYLLLDISTSMLFQGGKISKAQYAKYLVSALAFLMLKQRDATGLVLFDKNIRQLLPPKSVGSYLTQILKNVDNATHGQDTNIQPVLHQVAERLQRRGLVILVSDLLDNPASILSGLKHFRHNQHEVIVFHILDRKESELDYSGEILFEDLESTETIKTYPGFVKDSYSQKFRQYLDYMRLNCNNNRISYNLLYTDTPFNIALTEYLLKRKHFF